MKIKRRSYHETSSKLNPLKIIVKLVAILLILGSGMALFILYKINTLEKFAYIQKTDDGGAEILVVDSSDDKLIKYFIPADTELESARGYGEYKLTSLWVLSAKSEQKGKLVAETITKNYSLPIYLWRSGNSWKNGKEDNLNILQKVKVLTLQSSSDYDFEFTKNNLPDSVKVNFVEPIFSEGSLQVEIVDLTGKNGLVNKVSDIIMVLGGKITFNSTGFNESLDCEITGKNKKLIEVFDRIFDCNTSYNQESKNDVILRLGAKFAERF